MAFCTESMELLTSVPLICANLMNWPDRSSSASPVRPKRVFTSPIADPAVSKSVGIVVARSFARFCMSSSASPDAPVFVTMMSMPASTCLNAAMEAPARPTIGAVTPLLRVSPTLVMPSPTSFSFLLASSSSAAKAFGPVALLSAEFSLLMSASVLFSCCW